MRMHKRLEKEKQEPAVDGPFQCEICGREFLQLQSVKIHLGKHKANEESNLQEYMEKSALRLAASKIKNRQKSKVYKAKYKEIKLKKMKLFENLGIDPDSPIVKSMSFKDVVDATTDKVQEIQEDQTTSPQPSSAIGVNNEIQATVVVGNSVVLGSPIDPSKTLEYVVADPATVIVGAADEISELNVENMAPSFSLLSFIKQTKN